MNRRTTLITLWLFAAVAFVARVGVAVELKGWRSPNAMEHKSIAMSLAQGRGFTFGDWKYYGPTSVQSPPFPFLLAGLFKVFGTDTPPDGSLAGANRAYLAVMVLNGVAGAGLVFLTYAAARTLGAAPLAGVAAAALVAVWPTQVYAARAVQAITLITCALTGMTVLYYRAVRTGSGGAWTGYAFLAALAALTEPVFLPAVALSGGLMLLTRRLTWGQRGRNAAVLAFATAAVIGPWTARNYVVHGKLMPVKSTTWVNVWKGNNDFASGTDRLVMTDAQRQKAWAQNGSLTNDDVSDTDHAYDMLDLSQKARLVNRPEPFREAVFREFAAGWIAAHPTTYAQLCGRRLLKTLTVDWDNPRSYNKPYLASRAALILMTLAGLAVAWRQRWSLLFPALMAGCALATYTLTVTAARFSIPFEPLQLTLGAAALVAVLPKRSTAARPATREFEPALSVAGAR